MSTHISRLTFGLALGAAVALGGCGGGASSQWDPKASSALRAEPEALLRNLDAGNLGGVLAKMDDEAVVLDLDENNDPVRYQGRANVTEYFEHLGRAMKAQGLKLDSKIAHDDCTASSTFGYCVVEFDQTMTAGGQKMGPFKLRATIVVRKVGDEWRWTHWHGSFREMPPQESAGAASATSAASR